MSLEERTRLNSPRDLVLHTDSAGPKKSFSTVLSYISKLAAHRAKKVLRDEALIQSESLTAPETRGTNSFAE